MVEYFRLEKEKGCPTLIVTYPFYKIQGAIFVLIPLFLIVPFSIKINDPMLTIILVSSWIVYSIIVALILFPVKTKISNDYEKVEIVKILPFLTQKSQSLSINPTPTLIGWDRPISKGGGIKINVTGRRYSLSIQGKKGKEIFVEQITPTYMASIGYASFLFKEEEINQIASHLGLNVRYYK